MAHMFVANSSHQNIHFQYRLPETPNHRQLIIGPGRQVRFPEDLGDVELASLVKQLERYGAVPASNIQAIVTPRALVYRIDERKPISADTLNEAREFEARARQNVAAQELESTGMAQFQNANESATARETSLEVTQLDGHGDPAEGDAVSAEFVVSTKVAESTSQVTKRGKRRR